jgi:biopolymer transport protein ExbD
MHIERGKQMTKEISMIPLINLVFLLLIFFLVTGTIEKFEVIPIDLPLADSGKILDEGHIVVVVGMHGELIVNDRLISEKSLLPAVSNLLAENPRKIISLKADARSDAEKMIEIMNLLRKAGGQNLSLVTQSLN